jgi:CheY-like chemotaxis protein
VERALLQSILYVDDEPHIREIVEMALSLSGDLSVRTCDSGGRALALMREQRPDLVLLDVMMPDTDGPATLARMRSEAALASIPVVFMTAKAMPHEVSGFLQIGAIGVIAKPFDPMRLADQVLEMWERLAHSGWRRPDDLTGGKAALQERVASLGLRFLRRTLGELVTIRECLEACVAGDVGAIAQLERITHKIHGTGTTFGFERISRYAADLERLAKAALPGPIRDPEVLESLEAGARHLADEVERAAQAAGVSG